jgi:hypothetical protein
MDHNDIVVLTVTANPGWTFINGSRDFIGTVKSDTIIFNEHNEINVLNNLFNTIIITEWKRKITIKTKTYTLSTYFFYTILITQTKTFYNNSTSIV